MDDPKDDPMDGFALNPFYVLGVPVTASRAEIEREGLKLLGMLELGLAGARTYPSPVGTMERTPDRVREALAELRVPEKRLMHELWADPEVPMSDTEDAVEERIFVGPGPAPWIDALRALGFGR